MMFVITHHTKIIMKNLQKIMSIILILSMIISYNMYAYADASLPMKNKYSYSLIEELQDYEKYEIVNEITGEKEYFILQVIGDEVVYKSITSDNKVYTTKSEDNFVIVRDENNNIIEKVKIYENNAEESVMLNHSENYTVSSYGPWLKGVSWNGSSVVNTAVVSVLAGILATLCNVKKDASIMISLATYIISIGISIYFYKKTQYIRYSNDGETLQEQYVTDFYQNQDFSGYIRTVYSNIVTRIMK